MAGKEAPMLGMIFGVLSAAMVAIHAVLIKAALKSVDGKTLDLAYWQNALSALSLIPGILVSGELGGIWRMAMGEEGSLSAFAAGSVLTVSGVCIFSFFRSHPIYLYGRHNPGPHRPLRCRSALTRFHQGVVGFLICIAGLLSIKVTSPVTHMFSASVRSVLQTMLGVWLFKDVINASRAVSISLILGGSILYTYLKSRPRIAAATSGIAAAVQGSSGGSSAAAAKEESAGLLSVDVEKGERSSVSEGRRSSASAQGSEKRAD